MMDENEFKKLAANNRDWLIYQLLSERSKGTVEKEILNVLKPIKVGDTVIADVGDKVILDKIPPNPKGETTAIETVTGRVVLVTDRAVLIGDGDRVAWFPKSVIENLDKIVLDKDKIVELKIVEWFKYKIEWKVPTQ